MPSANLAVTLLVPRGKRVELLEAKALETAPASGGMQ